MVDIPKKSFYFVRHGETDWNSKRLIMGSKDIPLNENGITQAEHAAYILQDLEIGQIFSSNLQRARKTAAIIADICELEVEEMSELCERGRGALEGKSREDLLVLSHLTDAGIKNDEEYYQDFETRILSAINKILSSNFEYPLIVAHAGVFAVLANLLAEKQNIPCRNGEAFCFYPSVIQKNQWEIEPLERFSTALRSR